MKKRESGMALKKREFTPKAVMLTPMSQSRIYPNMCANFAVRRSCRTKRGGGGTDRQRDTVAL